MIFPPYMYCNGPRLGHLCSGMKMRSFRDPSNASAGEMAVTPAQLGLVKCAVEYFIYEACYFSYTTKHISIEIFKTREYASCQQALMNDNRFLKEMNLYLLLNTLEMKCEHSFLCYVLALCSMHINYYVASAYGFVKIHNTTALVNVFKKSTKCNEDAYEIH